MESSSWLAMAAPWHWHTWVGLGLLRVLSLLPFRAQLAVGAGIGWFLRHLPLKYVRVARRNLELCFPQLGAEERNGLLDRHFQSLGIGLCETANTFWASDDWVRAHVEVVGREHVERALARGRGVIVVGAHFTTIEFATRILNTIVPINVLYRPTKNPVLSRFLHRNTARHARRAIRYDDIRSVVRALKANEAVWYAPDQSFRNKGAALVPFFGIPAASNTGTSRLARLTGAAVLTYFPERLPGTQGYRVTIGPALEDFPSGDEVADVARYHELVEAHVRRVPEQYLWMHRRFKGLADDYPDYYGRDSRRRTRGADAADAAA